MESSLIIVILIALSNFYNVRSLPTYEKIAYYLDTSTSAQNQTCQGLTYLYQSSTSGSPRVMEFKINTLYGYDRLFYKLELHYRTQLTNNISFEESGINVHNIIPSDGDQKLLTLCSTAGFMRFVQFTTMTYLNQPQVTLTIKSNNAITFWVKSLNVYAQRCQKFCKICDNSNCQECMPDFEFNPQGSCICQYQFLTEFQGQCVTQCPINYYFNGVTCLQYDQKIILLQDNTASQFQQITDYNTTQRDCRIILEGKKVAGMFIQNEAVEYQINYPIGTKLNISIQVEIYIMNLQAESPQIPLYLRLDNNLIDYILIVLKDYQPYAVGLTKQKQCNIIGYKTCFKFTMVFNVDDIINLSLLQIKIQLPLQIKEISWAISYIQVLGIIKTSISCPFKRFKDNCLTECPIISRSSGNQCISLQDDYKFSKFIDISYTKDFLLQKKIEDQNIMILFYGPQYIDFYQERYLLGGYGVWKDRQIQLIFPSNQPHYKIKLFFKAILIDIEDSNQSLIVNIDQTQFVLNKNSPNSYCFSSVVTPGCIIQEDIGQTYVDYLINFEQEFYHSKTQLEILFDCKIKSYSRSFCALYDLVVLSANCPENCLSCQSDAICLQSQLNNPVFYDCPTEDYYYNEGSCQKCDSSCKICTNNFTCQICKDPYFLYGNKCICKFNQVISNLTDCQETGCYQTCSKCLNNQSQNCASCDRQEHKVFNVKVCECFLGYYMDTSSNPYTCQLCDQTCKTCSNSNTCLTCIPEQNRIYQDFQCLCKDGYFENNMDAICIKCITLCKSCRFKEEYCTKCHPEQYRILSKDNDCICQDGYYENQKDVCLKCSDYCESCTDFSICKSCNEDQYRTLDIYHKQCQCQLGYYDNQELTCLPCYYACSKCNNSNLISQCTLCPQTRQKSENSIDTFECVCRKGYFDIGFLECQSCLNLQNPPSTHYCYSYCGDLIIQWNEECDDGNLDQRDGCNQCFFSNNKCIDNICLNCQSNQCKQCVDGYYLNNDYECIQCSDECYTCELQQNNCTQCKFYDSDSQKCLNCNQDQGFIEIDNQCFSVCGDGIRTSQEQCDDSNLLNGDGCDQFCKVEEGYICDVQCSIINYIQILLQEDKFDTIYDSKRTIELKFNQNVKVAYNDSIKNLFDVISITPNLKITLISIFDNSLFQNDYYNIELDINIELDSSATSPEIQVTIQNFTCFTNLQGYSFKNNNATIQLIEFIKQDENVIQNTQRLTQMNSYFLYIFIGLAILAIIFGGLDIFWNLLDTLQIICYLKYFNITYPYNLQYYFTTFGFAEFDFLKSYFNFEDFITYHVDTPQADPKFYQEGYSTVFLVNIISVIIVFLTTTATYIVIRILLYFIHKFVKDYSEEKILQQNQNIKIFEYLFYKLTKNCQKYFLEFVNQFKSALIRTFMASAYDFNIAIFLQFKDINFHNEILKISSMCAIIMFLLEIYFLFYCFSIMNKDLATYKQDETKQNYGSLFEGLRLNRNPFNSYFNLFNLIKKTSFIAFLVFLYNFPCLQITLVSLLSLLQAIFLLINQPLEDKYELIKQISCELILWLSQIMILLFAFNEQSQIFNNAQLLNIGWAIIGFLSLIILIQLIIDCKQHIQFLEEKYQLLKNFKLWYNSNFQNEDNQSSLNTEFSSFSIIFNQKPKQLESNQKNKTNDQKSNKRRIVSFQLN